MATGITIKGKEEPGGRGDKRQGRPSTPGTTGQGCGQYGAAPETQTGPQPFCREGGTKTLAPSPSTAPVSWGKQRGGWFSCKHRK